MLLMAVSASFQVVDDDHHATPFTIGRDLLARNRAHVNFAEHCVTIPSYGVGRAGLHVGYDDASRDSLSGNIPLSTPASTLQPTFSALGNLRKRFILHSLAADPASAQDPDSFPLLPQPHDDPHHDASCFVLPTGVHSVRLRQGDSSSRAILV